MTENTSGIRPQAYNVLVLPKEVEAKAKGLVGKGFENGFDAGK